MIGGLGAWGLGVGDDTATWVVGAAGVGSADEIGGGDELGGGGCGGKPPTSTAGV